MMPLPPSQTIAMMARNTEEFIRKAALSRDRCFGSL
jgi:hypothetical protein